MALTKDQEVRREAFVMALQMYSATGPHGDAERQREQEILSLTDHFYKYLRGQD